MLRELTVKLKPTKISILEWGVPAALFLLIYLFLWLKCPQYLLYQEQNQLFLFTWNYFVHAVEVPGGLADYISEFIVQFCYVPLYGAGAIALILIMSQYFLGMAMRGSELRDAEYFLASIPSLLYVGAMSDENVLISFAVAMMLTSLFIYLSTMVKGKEERGMGKLGERGKGKGEGGKARGWVADTLVMTIGFIILYWLAGPLAAVFVIAVGVMRRSSATGVAVCLAYVSVAGIHAGWFQQYPLSRLLLGMNYYRVPEVYPVIFYVIAAVMVMVAVVGMLKIRDARKATSAAAIMAAIVTGTYVPLSFDADKGRALEYDSLVRQGRWNDIVEKARKTPPSDTFSLQALNLALGMTGQLTETMFTFPQKGIEGLIGSSKLDNTSQLITAEVLYRLGLTNIAFSTTFDLQEAIMNDRKSGRHLKRLAECSIINGNYDVASKYVGILKNSLFYKDWALQAERLPGDDRAVEAHQVYGPLRRSGFGKEAFYDHTQIEKILAMLALGSKSQDLSEDPDRESHFSEVRTADNTLAWEYFCAASLLKGELQTLAGVLAYQNDRGGPQRLPRHVQEALAMYWTFSHPNFDGMPFPLSAEVRNETAALARTASAGVGNTDALERAAPGSYGVYFFNYSMRNQE